MLTPSQVRGYHIGMIRERGKFIVFEHLDGAGGTTQAKMLTDKLLSWGITAEYTSEPTDSCIGKFIREMQRKGGDTLRLAPYLYIADRAMHVEAIQDLLDKGVWVICDRYWYSSVVYQGEEWEEVNSMFPVPDEVIYISLPINECLARIESRGGGKDVFETESFLRGCDFRYRTMASKYGFTVVDGRGNPDEVFSRVMDESKMMKALKKVHQGEER